MSLEERMKAEILQRLRQHSASASTALTSVDMPKDASDVDLSRQYLDDLDSRSDWSFLCAVSLMTLTQGQTGHSYLQCP